MGDNQIAYRRRIMESFLVWSFAIIFIALMVVLLVKLVIEIFKLGE